MKQTVHLLTMRVIGLACQGVAMLYLAAVLPEEDFGRYGLFVGFLALTHLLFEGGVYEAAARAGAFREGKDLSRLVGFVLICSAGFFVLYLGAGLGLAIAANQLDKIYFERQLWLAALFAPAVLVHFGLCRVCIGSNRIGVLAMLRSLPYAGSLGGVVLLSQFDKLTYSSAACSYTAAFLLSVLFAAIALKPRFDKLANSLNDTRKQAKYGFNIYLSRIVAMGVYKLDAPLVAFFLDFRSVGYYALARALLMPFALATQSFASTRYKQYTKVLRIPRPHLTTVYAISFVAATVPVLLGGMLLRIAFPDKPAVFFVIVQVLGIRVFFQSAYPIYNTYLAARGHARTLRQVAIVTSVLNLALYLVLIPAFGVLGAAWADALDCGAYLLFLLINYRLIVGKQQGPDERQTMRGIHGHGSAKPAVGGLEVVP